MVSPLDGAVAQSLAAGVGFVKRGLDRNLILRGDQRIRRAAEGDQAPLHLGKTGEAGRAAAWTHSADACAIEINAHLHLRQGGGQQRRMASEAEADHANGGVGVPCSQPGDRRGHIAEDLIGRCRLLMAATQCKICIRIAEIQIRCGSGKQRNSQGGNSIGRQPIGDAAHPGIHPEDLRKHDNHAIWC